MKCKDFNSNLFGWCDKKPTNQEPKNLKIVTNGIRGKNYIHKSKIPLMGSKRMKISKKLGTDIPSNWRRQNVDEMEFDQISPPNLYNNNTLSKAKQEYLDKKLGISETNIIESLIKLKHTSQSENIHTIGCDPLLVHYWTRQITHYSFMI